MSEFAAGAELFAPSSGEINSGWADAFEARMRTAAALFNHPAKQEVERCMVIPFGQLNLNGLPGDSTVGSHRIALVDSTTSIVSRRASAAIRIPAWGARKFVVVGHAEQQRSTTTVSASSHLCGSGNRGQTAGLCVKHCRNVRPQGQEFCGARIFSTKIGQHIRWEFREH